MKDFDRGEVIPQAEDFMARESKMMAVRMGPWKWHFATEEDYSAPV